MDGIINTLSLLINIGKYFSSSAPNSICEISQSIPFLWSAIDMNLILAFLFRSQTQTRSWPSCQCYLYLGSQLAHILKSKIFFTNIRVHQSCLQSHQYQSSASCLTKCLFLWALPPCPVLGNTLNHGFLQSDCRILDVKQLCDLWLSIHLSEAQFLGL